MIPHMVKWLGVTAAFAGIALMSGLLERSPLGELFASHHSHPETSQKHHHGDADDRHDTDDSPCHHEETHCCCAHAHVAPVLDWGMTLAPPAMERNVDAEQFTRLFERADAPAHIPKA